MNYDKFVVIRFFLSLTSFDIGFKDLKIKIRNPCCTREYMH